MPEYLPSALETKEKRITYIYIYVSCEARKLNQGSRRLLAFRRVQPTDRVGGRTVVDRRKTECGHLLGRTGFRRFSSVKD